MKKALCIMTTIVMLLASMVLPSEIAYGANITLGVSSSSIKIGDTVTVTISIPENVSGNLDLVFPNDVLEFSKASADVSVNGGTIQISMGKYGLSASSSMTVTFKAKTTGEASVRANSVLFADNETMEEVTIGNASTKITIANETVSESEDEKSADYYLAKLKLSNGSKTIELSPKFKYTKTKYTATVGYDVTSLVVSATRSSGKAEIVSITDNGNVKLEVGDNVIEIVVKAENGKTLTYTITVTRQEKVVETEKPSTTESETENPPENPTEEPTTSDFTVNGVNLHLTSDIPETIIPADFVEKTIVLNGSKEVSGLSFKNGELTVLYLENDNKVGNLYIYNSENDAVYPFIKLVSEKSYVIALMPEEETVPEGYTACTLSIETKGIVNAYQYLPEDGMEATDFYLIYCMNEDGVSGWYQYDMAEGTYQRYAGIIPAGNAKPDTEEPEDTEGPEDTQVGNSDKNELQEQYDALEAELQEAKDAQRLVICIAVFIGAVLVIIIINLIIAKNRGNDDDGDDDDDDDDDEYEDFDDKQVFKPIKPVEKKVVEEVDVTQIPEVTVEESDMEKVTPQDNDQDDELEFIDF